MWCMTSYCHRTTERLAQIYFIIKYLKIINFLIQLLELYHCTASLQWKLCEVTISLGLTIRNLTHYFYVLVINKTHVFRNPDENNSCKLVEIMSVQCFVKSKVFCMMRTSEQKSPHPCVHMLVNVAPLKSIVCNLHNLFSFLSVNVQAPFTLKYMADVTRTTMDLPNEHENSLGDEYQLQYNKQKSYWNSFILACISLSLFSHRIQTFKNKLRSHITHADFEFTMQQSMTLKWSYLNIPSVEITDMWHMPSWTIFD